MEDTLRAQYALSFYNYFSARFTVLSSTDPVEVLVTVDEFHIWLAQSGFAAFTEGEEVVVFNYVPERGTADWEKFNALFSKVRRSMNFASERAAHGDPAFRVDFAAPHYVVRNLPSQALVTTALMTKSLLSMVKNKDKNRARQHEYLQDNFDQLPPSLQHQVSSHDRMFTMLTRRMAADLNEYLAYVTEDYQEAHRLLNLPPPGE